MKNTKPISLKQLLTGSSVDFLRQEEMQCLATQDGLPELISQLLYYKEEGKALYPEIYIFDDLELIKKILNNPQICHIGKGQKTKDTMLKALKKCAPLTEGGWVIYILRREDEFEYGVLKAGESIVSTSVSEALIESGSTDVKAILVHQIAEKLIEVKGIKADTLLVSYGSNDAVSDSPIKNQIDFIKTIVKNVKDELRDPVTNFLKKVFLEVLQKGHGTLACVIDSKKKTLPIKLQDGIELRERINITEAIADLLDKKDLQANSVLEGYFSLITGMMESDGITVFTNNGEIAAYNVFVKHPPKLTSTTGGARSRTFLTLCKMIKKGIESAYIQSQDGKIEFKDGK